MYESVLECEGGVENIRPRIIREVIIAHRIRISDILSWDRKYYLKILSYPGRQVTSCDIAF